MSIATNPYQFEPKQLDHLYTPASKISQTQIAISNHLNLSTRGAGMAHAAAVDIDKLNSALTQNTIDIFHQSPLPWNEFKANNAALNNLGNQTLAVLDSYKTNFDRCLYAPLSSLLSSPRDLLPGKPDLLLQEISTVYDDLKRKCVPSNCCLQICLRFQNSSNSSCFAAKETMYTDFDSIGRVMRDCIGSFDLAFGCYCYKRYEILMDNEQFQIFEAKCNDSIPECSFLHPLCKIYNTTQNILPTAELNAKTPGLITVAFLKCHDCIRVDLLVSDGGQLYGKRIFKDDLTNTIPALFKNSQFKQSTQSLLDKLKLVKDPEYNEYCQHLKVCTKRLSLAHKLPAFVRECADDHNRYDLDISKLQTFFNNNNIDDVYIERNTVKEFRQLLADECGVSAGAATALWQYLGGFDQDNHQNLGSYTFSFKTDSKIQKEKDKQEEEKEKENDDEDEYDPMQDSHVDFYGTLLEIYPEYYEEEDFDEFREQKDEILLNNQLDDDDHKQNEIVNTVQYGSYSYYSSKQFIKDDDNNDYDDESLSIPWSDDDDDEDNEFENGLSPPPSEWDSGEELELGESLSTPSEWQHEPDINVLKDESYHTLHLGTIVFPGNDAIIFDSMLSHEAMANWLIIRYLLFYERYISEFYPSPKL